MFILLVISCIMGGVKWKHILFVHKQGGQNLVEDHTNRLPGLDDQNEKPDNPDTQNNQLRDKRLVRKRESSIVKKIVLTIVFVAFLLISVVGATGYQYIMEALKPLSPAQHELVEVEIPMDTSSRGIAEILENEQVIRDATVFRYYLRAKDTADFQAGFYQLSPAMSLDEIIETLAAGGTNVPISEEHKILVKEGATLEEIASEFEQKSDYSQEEFLEAANDQEYISQLAQEFPHLLTEKIFAEEIRYPLEGYLFPATYDYLSSYTPYDVIRQMIQKTDEILQPYREQIEAQGISVHALLTLASLIEKEGVNQDDRQTIAGVLYNRLVDDMPLQSDVSVLYVLDRHLEYVTIEDTEVESPYNLYQNKGLGPGPFNSPSEGAILAALNPAETDYYYFLADLDTGIVYFSRTFEEHLELQEQYIDDSRAE